MRGCGCIVHPAFPTPSFIFGREIHASLGQITPRERGGEANGRRDERRAFFLIPRPLWGGWHIVSGANECRVGVAHDSAQTDNLLKQPPPVSLIASRSASHPPHASRGRDKKEQRPRSSRECGGVGRLSDVVIARSERDAAIHPGLAKKAGLLRRCTPRNDGRDERWGRGVLLLPPPRSVGRDKKARSWRG